MLTEPLPPIPADAPQAGQRWVHFKGDTATIVGTSRHSETGELLVVYTKGTQLWSRPLALWHDNARPNIKRFVLLPI